MPSKIRVLSDHTINKIAAGEVIENPASVVKELVENAIDAGSKEICIEIKGGGRQLIRISDDGCGMNSDDAVLCLERHATSKLREVEDIHTLLTMGFRGEAIPSIASISKFNLLTCPANENKDSGGTMVIVDGGQLISCKPAPRSQGTTIEVKTLFFNVPVRKKFLKSPATDANEILKTVSLLALGHPALKFKLISEGKTLLDTHVLSTENAFTQQLKHRIEDVLGNEFSENLSFIDKTLDKITLQGGFGVPGYTRHNRSSQYLFINQRAVASPLISYAVKEGFGTSIPAGRFPAFVLHLTLPGSWIDVNVHPQKREVRLRQEQIIKELIINTVRSTLRTTTPLFDTQDPPPLHHPFDASWRPQWVAESTVPEQWSKYTNNLPETSASFPKPLPKYTDDLVLSSASVEPYTLNKPAAPLHQAVSLPLQTRNTLLPKVTATLPGYFIIEFGADHPILAKGCRHPEKQGLIIVDQKGAHSRIIFEKLSSQSSMSSIPQQSLLIPKTLELTPYESQILRRSLPHLNSMGLSIKEFGNNTFVIDALPKVFGNNAIDQLIADILNEMRSWQETHEPGDGTEIARARQIAQAASRTAVSNGRKLSLEEAQNLFEQLIQCETPTLCPLGKPVFTKITLDDLAKLFQR